ncbi:MAG TPA: L,D-transpeptidase family protein [Candidatus Binatia bacterium]|nr:L,D-transpeptidase family protein [Candidatus Binatia bacterium]
MAERRTPIVEQKTGVYRPRRTRSERRIAPGAPPPPLYIPARSDRAGAHSRRAWPAVLLFLALVFVCGGLALLAAGWSYQRDKVLPGVHVLQVPLGGLPVAEAARQLKADWNARRVLLQQGSETALTLPPADVGILLDSEATARAAYRQGRNLQAPEVVVQALIGRVGIQPIWYFDPDVARERLNGIAPRFEIRPTDAGVEFVDGTVRATAAVAGQRLDVEGTLLWLQQNAVQVAYGEPVQLILQPVEPQVTDVGPLVAELSQRISASIFLHTFDPVSGETEVVEVAPDVWASWLALETESKDGTPQLSWRVDAGRVALFVRGQSDALGASRYLELDSATETLVSAIEEERQDVALRVYHAPQTHVVQSGETLSSIAFDYGIPYPWIQQANPGLGEGLSVGEAITIPSPDELIPLPVVQNKRILISLSEQRLWAYENGSLKWEWPVSTGIDSSPTAPGVFQIQSHEPNAYASIWDLWMPQFMGIYRPVPTSDFMNGFHGFPTRNGSNLLWTNSLGHKVTYGCILVSNDNVALLYEWAETGVIVEVRP